MEVLVQESHSQDLLIFLYKLYQERLLCDMEIESGDGVIFCIHRMVLASTSSYIHHMILSNPALSKLKLNVPSKAIQLLLEFGYTGQLFVSNYLRQDMLYAATVLQMNSVLDLMKKETHTEEGMDKPVCDKMNQMSTVNTVQDNTTASIGNFEDCDIVIKTEPLDPETAEIESAVQNTAYSNCLESSKQVVEKFEIKHKNKEPHIKSMSNVPHGESKNLSLQQINSRDRNHLKSDCDSKRRSKKLEVNLSRQLVLKSRKEILYLKWLYSRYLIKKSLQQRYGAEYSDQQTGFSKWVCCNGCGKSFLRYSLFFLHLNRTHFQHKTRSWFSFPFLHLKCKLNTTSNVVAEKSARSMKKKKFKCTSCSKEFGSKTGLNAHVKTHVKKIHENKSGTDKKQKQEATSLSIVKLKCLLCNKESQSEAGLCRHLMINTAHAHVDIKASKIVSDDSVQSTTTKRFVCKMCTYTTERKANLTRHVKVHTKKSTCEQKTGTPEKHEQTEFLCDQCAKRFKTRYGLSIHKKQHDGVFKHTCKVCKKGFNQTTQFRSHFARHHDIPTSECTFCKKTFTGHSSLQRHLSICSSNPNADREVNQELTCKDCSQTFSSKEALAYHTKGKHGAASYVCDNCGKTYSWRSSLRAHKALCR